MERIIDIELWSKPRMCVTPLDGKAIAEVCRSNLSLPEEVVLGLNFVPDEIDVQNIQFAILSGEFSADDFAYFCAEQGLSPNIHDQVSASHFLAYEQGQPLAWLHFPENQLGYQMANTLFHWAEVNGFDVVQGQGETPLTESLLRGLWPQTLPH